MLLSEIYQSKQGEGRLVGTPSVFIRTSGCNLRCGFCDTPFASWKPEGQQRSVDEIVHLACSLSDGAQHVVITGGEPMLPREMPELTRGLKQQGFHITIETAGTIDKPVVCDLMSISPKLSNSDPSLERAGEDWLKRHQATRQQPEIVQALIDRYPYQLKFVVDSVEDVDEIGAYLEMVTDWDPARVMLMPEGIRQDELERKEVWLKPICDQRGFQLCRRMHILWYGNRRGT